VETAAERYRQAGRFTWEVARSKLGMDEVYLEILENGVLPGTGTLVDLGCGHGLMLSLVDAARTHFQAADWPSNWPTPPLDLELRGIELRPRVAARASALLEDVAVIESTDATRAALPRCHAVLLLDVLHLIRPSDQERVLREVKRALVPGGVLVLREADAAAGMGFRAVWLGNRIVALVTGHPTRTFHYRSMTSWQDWLRGAGFDVVGTRANTRGPFANFVVYARAPSDG
jgi:SAM-dependent methyltransferase